MAVALAPAGHWITTDSGTHILIEPGKGSVRAQVRAHYRAKGQSGHPDEKAPIKEHKPGVNPNRKGGVGTSKAADSLRERIKRHKDAGEAKRSPAKPDLAHANPEMKTLRERAREKAREANKNAVHPESKPPSEARAKAQAAQKAKPARDERIKRLDSKMEPAKVKTLRERAAELKASKRAVDQGRAEKIGDKPKEGSHESKFIAAVEKHRTETTTSHLAGAPTQKATFRERIAQKAMPKPVEAEAPAPRKSLREAVAEHRAKRGEREAPVSDKLWERGQRLKAQGKAGEAAKTFERHDELMRRQVIAAGEGSKLTGSTAAASHINHAPGTITQLNTDLVHFDPDRFQYKLAAQGQHGVTDALKGVKRYDPELAGVMQVWKDPEAGKVFVINGHHRLDLAKKLGAERVGVQFINAKNAEEARSIGAVTNIAQGRGTSLDAAKFFRDTGMGREHLEAKGIPMQERTATEGLALSNLHEPIFKRVVNQEITPARGAIIGNGLSHAQQTAVMKQLDKMPKGKSPSDATLRETVEHAKQAPTTMKTTHGLFGDDEEEVSLALHRGEATAHVRERLSREKRVFGTVARERNASDLERGGNVINAAESGKISQAAAENLATFDLLKHRSGPVSHLLNEAATRVAAGEKKAAVHADIYGKLPEAIRTALAGG